MVGSNRGSYTIGSNQKMLLENSTSLGIPETAGQASIVIYLRSNQRPERQVVAKVHILDGELSKNRP